MQWHNYTVGAIFSWTSPPQQVWGRWVAGVNQRQLLQVECGLGNANAWIKRLITYREGSSGEQVIHFLKSISSVTWRKPSGFSEFHLPPEPHRNAGSESLGWKALWEWPCQPPSVDSSVRWHPFYHRTSFYSPWISSITAAFRIHFLRQRSAWILMLPKSNGSWKYVLDHV